MLFAALLLPPFMLVAVLALGRYEETLLGRPDGAGPHAGHPAREPAEPRPRHLHAVPNPNPSTARPGRAPGRGRRSGGRHAA
ncbi:hypothetical protein [Streptomyces sp. NPDC048606]|uniref:hypothetical protein n=1 Tax=Streptomyces sp. NPDC048606 TaxID=3154726 RepID=UPI003433A617